MGPVDGLHPPPIVFLDKEDEPPCEYWESPKGGEDLDVTSDENALQTDKSFSVPDWKETCREI